MADSKTSKEDKNVIPLEKTNGGTPIVPLIFGHGFCCCDYDQVHVIQPTLVAYLREHVIWLKIRTRETRFLDYRDDPFQICSFLYRIKERSDPSKAKEERSDPSKAKEERSDPSKAKEERSDPSKAKEERPNSLYRLIFNVRDIDVYEKWHALFKDLKSTLKARHHLENGKIRRVRLRAPPIWSIDKDILKENPRALVVNEDNVCVSSPDQELIGKDFKSILNEMTIARGVAFCLSFCWSSDIDSGK
jgi:hypothetical protein